MKLAVKFWADEEENARAIPGVWPSRLIELEDSSEIPSGYSEITIAEYAQYRITHKDAYNTWATTNSEALFE
jgi:hypothetical protein